MLDELHVRNLALISDATIEPAPGLTALTGETGAGKSALLSAIKLLIGDRASGDAVRDGADSLSVEGRFFLHDRDGVPIGDPDEGTLASRRVNAQGRSRCTLDGSMATVAQLSQVIGASVDLCGQHDHQKLLSPTNHLPLLDAWAGQQVREAREAYEKTYEEYMRCSAELKRVLEARNAEKSRVEDARFALSRIDEVAPEQGEYEQLEADLPKLEHAEALVQAANTGYEALSGDGGALDALNTAIDALERVGGYDQSLDKIASSLHDSVYALEDANSSLRRYRDDVDFDPDAFNQAQERMSELIGLVRMFGHTMDDVFARRDEAASLVQMVDDSDRLEQQARAHLATADEHLKKAADALSLARRASAPKFADAVTTQMGRLHMSGASLIVEVERLARNQWSKSGADRVTFLYRPGQGMTPRPFAKIASGGEVSRVMLSIKVALGAHDDVDTLIFDEIDAGVGGETARAVAEVLADLAKTHQVIVVTHLAQIAVRAQRQYVVSKGVSSVDNKLQTTIEAVSGEDRVREIARMLSGDVEQTSLAHARTMLQEAAEL